MSFSKNRKRSGVILAGVTTASVAANAASHGIVMALPQNSAATSLLNNVPGEGAKNAGSSIVNFLKNNYGWLILAVVVIVGATVFLTDGGEEKEVVKNKEEYGQGGEGFSEIHEKYDESQYVPEIDNNIKNENGLDFENKADKINKKEPSLLDVILSKMEEINSADSKIEDKEEARGNFLKNYKLGSFFHTFFKKGRKIGDIKFDKEKGKLFYEDENKSAVTLIPGKHDTDGVNLEKEILEKIHNKVRFLNIISGFIDNNAFSLGLLGIKFKIKPSELDQKLTEHDTSLLKKYKDEIKFNEDVDSLEIKVVAFSGGSPTVRVRKVGEKAWSQCALNFKKIDNNTNIADYINFLNLLFKRAGEQNKWEYILRFNYVKQVNGGISPKSLCKMSLKSGVPVHETSLSLLLKKPSNGEGEWVKHLRDEDYAVVAQDRIGSFGKVFFMEHSAALEEGEDYSNFFKVAFEPYKNKIFEIYKSELLNIVHPSTDLENFFSSVEDKMIAVKINEVDENGRLNLCLLSKEGEAVTNVDTLYATYNRSKIEGLVKCIKAKIENFKKNNMDVMQKDKSTKNINNNVFN